MYLPSQQDMPADAYESNDDALAEQARELYWRGFQRQMQDWAHCTSWPTVIAITATVMRHGPVNARSNSNDVALADFAETEGWPNTLRALARAIEQQAVLDQANADPRR